MTKNNFASKKTAMSTALDSLSRRSLSVAQLHKRLEQKGFTKEDIQETVTKLMEWNYLNDQEYAQSYIRSKRDKYSKIKTMVELQRIGIDRQQSLVLMEQVYTDEQEYQNCLELLEKLWNSESAKWDRKHKDSVKHGDIPREILLKKKVGDKLLMRGFPLDSVKKALANFLTENS